MWSHWKGGRGVARAGVLIGLCGRRGAGGGMGPTETRKIGEKLGGELVD